MDGICLFYLVWKSLVIGKYSGRPINGCGHPGCPVSFHHLSSSISLCLTFTPGASEPLGRALHSDVNSTFQPTPEQSAPFWNKMCGSLGVQFCNVIP